MTPPPTNDTDGASGEPETETGLQYGEHGRCTATARSAGRRCQRPATGAHGKCRFHGGASTGPRDPSALEGNDHAAGNSGGGAPEGNTNALESGAFVPLRRIPERLTVEQLHGVARWHWWAILTARVRRPELTDRRRRRLAERWALLDVRRLNAEADVWGPTGRGFTYERERTAETADGETVTWTEERLNPSALINSRAMRRRLDIAETLGLYEHDAPSVEAAERRAAPPSTAPTRDDHTDD
jgi:hypothetical protein